MTDQTEDFRDYITETQKMRAYRGKIEPGSPLAPKPSPAPPRAPVAEAPKAKPKPVARPAPAPDVEHEIPEGSSAASNLIAVAAIVVLSVAAIALTVALLLK